MADDTLSFPSSTARRVAAYRLGVARLAATGHGPEADDRLAQDVAGDTQVARDSGMARYLQARTAFFDQAVVDALDSGLTQVVVIGAGYDGRALRYARPGVHWFELDRAATQHDKRDRLRRLQIDASQVRFIAADLADVDLPAALATAGHRPDLPSLVLCEGVAVYLPRQVLIRLAAQLRSLASHGSRLALSTGIPAADPDHRARLATRLDTLGEPLLLGSAKVPELLRRARWATLPQTTSERRAGLLTCAPVSQGDVRGGRRAEGPTDAEAGELSGGQPGNAR